MGLHIVECEGFEADDILGTLSRQCEEMGVEALLVTGDRDSFQLAGDNTTILYTKRGIAETQRVTPAWVRETYGVSPAQLIDCLLYTSLPPAPCPAPRRRRAPRRPASPDR